MTTMARNTPWLLFFAIVSSVCTSVFAQTDHSASPSHVKEIPAPLNLDDVAAGPAREVPASTYFPAHSPFALDTRKVGVAPSIRVLSESEMSREDQDLVADAESSIREKAGFQNMEFEREGWTYHELVCAAMPKHMFLRFTRDDGTRQMSMFSAAIPRDGNGSVRIIPIVRKGYSLFSPAPIGALTIAAFNRIRAEEGEGASADWVGTGLCYAALAGANPAIAEPEVSSTESFVAILPTLIVTGEGGAIIRFADISTAAKPMEWTLNFDSRGKLVKASHSPASVVRVGKPIPGPIENLSR